MGSEVSVTVALWGFDSFSLGMTGSYDVLDGFSLQGITLIAIGLAALLVTGLYLKDRDSAGYRVAVIVGKIVGVGAMMTCLIFAPHFERSTIGIALVGSFLLIMRSPRDVNFPVILALLFMAVVYVSLEDVKWLDPSGYPRVAITLALGMFVYVLLRFLQAVASVLSSLVNVISYWPILAAVAIVCVIEGVCLLLGYGSVCSLVFNICHASGDLVLVPLRVTGS